MKKFLIIVLIISAILLVPFAARIRSQLKWKIIFSSYKSDFETVNEYILSICSNDVRTSFLIDIENHEVSSLTMYSDGSRHGTQILLEDNIKAAINNIRNNAMIGPFDCIEVTPDRIIHRGLGSTWYVYSRNGAKIKYLYSPDNDKGYYHIYYLNDNWYLFEYM